MSLKLNTAFSARAYQAGVAQSVYALLDFKPEASLGRRPLDLRVVLDVSGSMSAQACEGQKGTKLELLKRAVLAMLDELEAGDHLTLVTFDHEAEVLFEDVVKDARSLEKLRKALHKLAPGGGTNILKGLSAGLAAQPLPDRVTRLVLVTDGEGDACEESDCERLAFDGRGTLGWLVYGIGIGYNDAFLDALARANGGTYVHLHDLNAAARTFEDEIKVMGEVAVSNLVVAFEPAPGVSVVRGDRVVPQLQAIASTSANYLSADLGDVDRVRGQKLLLQLAVPALPAGSQTLGLVRMSYHVPARKLLNQTAEEPVVALFAVEAGVPDDEVLRTVQLAGASRLTTIGMAELANGNGMQGARTLASAASVYQGLGRDDLSTQLKTLASSLTTRGALDAEGEEVRRTLTTMTRQAWLAGGDGHA